jgi:HTH-type transcriptional regulator / antitoxin HipB
MKLQGLKISAKNILKQKTNNKIMAKTKIKSYSLAEMKDKYIGKAGTPDRDKYEYELRMDVLGRMIKAARQERNLTQEQLGELVGVQKAQISKLESSANSATIDTVLKVFKALKADIHFNVTLEKKSLQLV